MKIVPTIVVMLVLTACAGGAAPTTAPTAAGTALPTATTAPAEPTGDAGSAEALCLLTPEDWQQFNYVTGASPDVTSDGPGSAICQYASGLFLEVYTEETEAAAEETFQTVLENAPFDEQQALPLPGAAEVAFDPDLGDGHAGIAVRAGRLTYTITVPSGEEAQAQLLALAGFVQSRAGDYV